MAREPKPPMHIEDLFEEKARTDPGYAIAHALMKLARAQENVGAQLRALGNGDASGGHGAIEFFGMHIGEKLDALTGAISDLADKGD